MVRARLRALLTDSTVDSKYLRHLVGVVSEHLAQDEHGALAGGQDLQRGHECQGDSFGLLVDLGGTLARTLAYGNAIPAPLIRANVGDELAVSVANRLNHPTSVRWHGIALRNDMDGVQPATPNINAGADFTYRFSSPHPGTYWAHPHTGLDADYGLYLPVIIDDPTEPGRYDAEWIVMLDDWTDGIGKTPEQLYDDLTGQHKPGMDNMPTACPGWR